MATNNSINLSASGICKYDGAGSFSAITVTQHSVLIGAASNGITSLALTSGQLAIGSTGADPSAATLTAGTGIAIANGAGSITISSVGGGLSWSVITADQTAAINNGYICNKAGLLTLTLPTTSAVGSMIACTNINTAAGIKISYTTNQSVIIGTSASTTTTGNVASIALGDGLILVCTVANLTWQAISTQGNWTIA